MKKSNLTDKEKESVVADFLSGCKGETLIHITNYLMIRLAEEAIHANAEVIKMSTSIQPKGVDERRDIALLIFQKRQSQNKVEDLSSLLQAAPDMFDRLKNVLLTLMAHPDYQTKRNQEFIDQVSSIENVIRQALGEE